MTEKGLVRRQELGRGHLYQARYAEEETQRRLVGDLLDRAFGGSAAKLVLQALAATRATAEERRQSGICSKRRASVSAIDIVTQTPLANAIGWALLQFIWQGALVGALTAGALLGLRRGAADVRYVVSCLGLVLMITLPVATAIEKVGELSARQELDMAEMAAGSSSIPIAQTASGVEPISARTNQPSSAPAIAVSSSIDVEHGCPRRFSSGSPA